MKKIALSIALAAGIMSAKAQDTTCTYFVGNEVYEFNYQTSEVISEEAHNSGLYIIRVKEGDVLCLDFSDSIPCTWKVITTYSDGEEDIAHLDANDKVYFTQGSVLRVQVGVADYKGCISGDCENGQGTFSYSVGDKYVGEWKNGLLHGQGTYTSADGDKYVGEWKDGLMHGQGTLTYADGTSQKGLWQNDKFVGK